MRTGHRAALPIPPEPEPATDPGTGGDDPGQPELPTEETE